MNIMSYGWKILWKIPVVTLAVAIGSMAASQAGWSGAEMVVNFFSFNQDSGSFVTKLFFVVGFTISVGTLMLVRRIAKPMLWLMVPILAYFAAVPGVWNGTASDFDSTRYEAIKYKSANADALDQMSERSRFLSCQDSRIELTADAKVVCEHLLNVGQGDHAPGGEHGCGPFGIFGCFSSEVEKKKPNR